MYDREHTKVGFWKTNCSELWERLHISDAPTPVTSSSEGTNSTEVLGPSVAPSESPHSLHQGIVDHRSSIIFPPCFNVGRR